MSIAATPTVVHDIVDSADERELWIVAKEHERPPFFHAGKGGDTRLTRAIRLCLDDKITPQSDGSYQVQGSEGRVYRVADSCSCPQSQKANSRWCYHSVAVALYIEWRTRCAPAPPVVLGTLRAGTAPLAQDDDDTLGNGDPVDDETLPLPLPPVTVDERLATVPASPIAQEAPMDDPYIPEPVAQESASTAIVEPRNGASHDTPLATPRQVEPLRVSIPAEYVMSIKGKRHVLYAGLVIGAQRSGLLTLSADWTYNDAELSLAHAVCTFTDGRRYEDSGDASPGNVNKGIAAHFRRVALTRAKARCLRDALGIQECSVEELEGDEGKAERETPDMTSPLSEQDLKTRLWQRIKVLAPDVARDEVHRWVHEQTRLALMPKNYAAILAKLEDK